MDKKDLIKYIDRINLTGPGGRDKIKKILMDFAINGAGGGGGGGGGGEDNPALSNPYYYSGRDTAITVDENTGSIVSRFPSSGYSIVSNIPCTSKYYYIALPAAYTLKRVMTENNENITELFVSKGAFLLMGIYYILKEFHLSSDIPLNVNITITVVE